MAAAGPSEYISDQLKTSPPLVKLRIMFRKMCGASGRIARSCQALVGRLELTIGSDQTVLEPGDSIYFDSNLSHAYRSLDPEPATAFMVLAYPQRTDYADLPE